MKAPCFTILMADDDPEDCLLMEHALRQSAPHVRLRFVHDGVALVAHLQEARKAGAAQDPFPGLVLLDINMPRCDGLQALAQIKEDPELRRLPVVMLTSSQAEKDVDQSYGLGASAYVTKPMDFEGLTAFCATLSTFYLKVASLPT